MSEQAIVLNQLTKHYGTHRGINDLSFSVNEGEFFGFIGPNGAGKSTTIRTLMGLIHPSGGNASIFGLDCQTKASVIARDVVYLPSENSYIGTASGRSGFAENSRFLLNRRNCCFCQSNFECIFFIMKPSNCRKER